MLPTARQLGQNQADPAWASSLAWATAELAAYSFCTLTLALTLALALALALALTVALALILALTLALTLAR